MVSGCKKSIDSHRYKKTEHTLKLFFFILQVHHFYDDSHNEKDCGDNKGNFLKLLDVASNSKRKPNWITGTDAIHPQSLITI